jgi:cardiolipin synthase
MGEGPVTTPRDPSARLTVPNLLSAARLASVPVFVALFAGGYEEAAVILYGLGAASDFVDGYLARRTGSVTELGKILDPLADRVFIVALVAALVIRNALPLWLAAAIVVRDLLVLAAFPVLDRRGVPRLEVSRTGKAATALLLTGLTLLAWSRTSFPLAGPADTAGLGMIGVGAVLYWVAAIQYGGEARHRLHAASEKRNK